MLLLKQAQEILELSSFGIKHYRGGWQDYLASKEQHLQGATKTLEKSEKILKADLRSKQKNKEKLNSKASQGKKSRNDGSQTKLILNKQKEQSETTASQQTGNADKKIIEAKEKNRLAQQELEVIKPQAFIVSQISRLHCQTLILQDLRSPYGFAPAISLQLQFGDRLWIQGDNGSGKTSLLNLISGTLKPLSGQISGNKNIGLLAQHFN